MIGRPFGPDGTLRHGLIAYCAIGIMKRLKMKPTRGVRRWDTAAIESQWRSESVRPMESVGGPAKDGFASKDIDFFTVRETPDGYTIAFQEPSGCR